MKNNASNEIEMSVGTTLVDRGAPQDDVAVTEPVAAHSSQPASGGLLARNAILNLSTEGVLFVALVLAIPKLVSGLGRDGFGLFSIAWIIIGYLSLFDVGVSRAATTYISKHLAASDLRSVRSVVRAAVLSNVVLGLVGGAVAVLAAPLLVRYAFAVPPDLQREARLVVYGVAVALPALLLQGVLRSMISSFQRFGSMNLVNSITTTLQWVIACWLAVTGHTVSTVVASTVAMRVVTALIYGVLLYRVLGPVQWRLGVKFTEVVGLLRFGGWVTVSLIISPILVYVDRMFIASFVSMAAVTLYTVPYETVFRLRILPASLVATSYPAFSERAAASDHAGITRLYQASLRYMLLMLTPAVMLLSVFGGDILSLWMGSTFAQQASGVLQILAIGALINCLANIPFYSIQALGKPSLTGKFHLIELPVYIVLCLGLIPVWGITGAAVANSLRLTLDAILLFWAAKSRCRCDWLSGSGSRYRQMLYVAILATGAMIGARFYVTAPLVRTAIGLFIAFAYMPAAWLVGFDHSERPALVRGLRSLTGASIQPSTT